MCSIQSLRRSGIAQPKSPRHVPQLKGERRSVRVDGFVSGQLFRDRCNRRPTSTGCSAPVFASSAPVYCSIIPKKSRVGAPSAPARLFAPFELDQQFSGERAPSLPVRQPGTRADDASAINSLAGLSPKNVKDR